MRQKYLVSLDDDGKMFNIREYAVTDNRFKNYEPSMLSDENFSFLCEETYALDDISKSIAEGIADLVGTLRTPNFFPNARYAAKIAEAVMTLHDSSEDGRIELFFDDIDSFGKTARELDIVA